MTTDHLTPRENDVLERLARGGRVKTIAEQFEISEATVRAHLRNIFSKLEVHSQAELIKRFEADRASGDGASPDSSFDEGRQAREYQLANERATEVARVISANKRGVTAIKEIVETVLPFDEQTKREWLTRFRVWSVEKDNEQMREIRAKSRASHVRIGLAVVTSAQKQGTIRGDLDPEEIVDTMYGLVISAAARSLYEDSDEFRARQLRTIDAYLCSITAER